MMSTMWKIADYERCKSLVLWLYRSTAWLVYCVRGRVLRNIKILARKSSEEIGARVARSVDVGRYEDQASAILYNCGYFLSVT